MGSRDLPDMYALGLWVYISGKSLLPILQLILVHTPYLCTVIRFDDKLHKWETNVVTDVQQLYSLSIVQ